MERRGSARSGGGGGGGGGGRSRAIIFRCSLRNTVYEVLKARQGWVEADGDNEYEWDLFWADTSWVHEHFDRAPLQEGQRVNHFRNHYETCLVAVGHKQLTRKDLLVKNLKRARKQLDKESRLVEAASFTFFPQTFSLPSEYNMFVEEFKKSGGVWIMKPCGRAQGRGIFLIDKLSKLSEWKASTRGGAGSGPYATTAENYICQRYIHNPYLIGGKKFDMRIYVLVTSFMPLQVYLYRSGFCRFSANRFTMHKAEIANTMIHLTNVAVQKTGENYDYKSGMKWALRDLKLFLISRHPAEVVHELFTEVESLITRSLQAVQNTIIHDKKCFELYGYDIIVDEDFKPWLLEVNASPSLTSDTEDDRELKCAMLEDALDVLDLEGCLPPNHSEPQVGGFDLIYNGGYVQSAASTGLSSLGNHNSRLKRG